MNQYVMTVTGPIPVDQVGQTLMHEHVICDITLPSERTFPPAVLEFDLSGRYEIAARPISPGVYRLHDEDVAAAELSALRAEGGRTVVELTTAGICPNPDALQRISRNSGVQIVYGAGIYYDPYVPRELREKSVTELSDWIVSQLTEGHGQSGILAGIIGEVGTSWPITPFEVRSLRASARAQQITGASINVHPGRHPKAPFDVCSILEEAGGDLSRVIMSHIDRTYPDDLREVLKLARICVVEYDLFGIESSYWLPGVAMPSDIQRIDAVRRIMDAGLASNLTISQDICTVTRLLRYGGHGYRHINRDVVPLMLRHGFSAQEIETLLVSNPGRLLSLGNAAEGLVPKPRPFKTDPRDPQRG